MIGKLAGTVDSISDEGAILDVNGVGYLVLCPTSTVSRLSIGARAQLMTEMKVSDDQIRLYGFGTAQERQWFRLLQTVQNVGAKLALSVLSTLSPRELEQALARGDKAMIGRAPGVGPKLALRIATELKDKVPAMMSQGREAHSVEYGRLPNARGPQADAVSALIHLGYAEAKAAEAVARALRLMGENAQTAQLIREALKGMSS